jgi:tetratricopeptide (TPR) repeat protein
VGRAGEIIASTPLEAESMLWKAVEIVPDNAKAYLVLGKRYTRIKDYPRAIDVYRKAVHLDPLMADAFFNLGYIYATLGKYEAAEEAFSRVVRLKPPYLDKSLFNLAVVQQKLGKKTESLSNLEQAVTLGLESKKALAYLSRLKQAGGKNTPVSTR